MAKLKKADFNRGHRFREARREGLVSCVTCSSVSGDENTGASCTHDGRTRKIMIASEYSRDPKSSWHAAGKSVCDAYSSRPLPEGVVPITFGEGEGAVLNSQFADCLHVDAKCPYVTEEQRLAESGGVARYNRRREVRIVDITETVPGETHRDACEMSCCDSKLQFQISDPNTYRNHVGIHPNADDPEYFVRNAMHRHGKNSDMTYEESEEFFDLTQIVSGKDAFGAIIAISDHRYNHANALGSRPLSEATNPIWLPSHFDLLAVPAWMNDDFNCQSMEESTNTGADFWVYDNRLFDSKKGLDIPLVQLQRVPEGIIPCVDSKGVFRKVRRVPYNRSGERFYISGILKPVEDGVLLERGLSHFIDIREVSYHAPEHYWGETGIGFSGLESFHEQ